MEVFWCSVDVVVISFVPQVVPVRCLHAVLHRGVGAAAGAGDRGGGGRLLAGVHTQVST